MFNSKAATARNVLQVVNKRLGSSINNPIKHCDAIIVGAGIAGSSVGYELAKKHNLNVIVLEQEYFPGYHSTGRAAGLFAENYGTNAVKLLTIASRNWFENPPLDCNNDIDNNPILTPSGLLKIATKENKDILLNSVLDTPCDDVQIISLQKAKELAPIVTNDDIIADQCVWESAATSLDIGNVHQSYLRGCKHNNVDIICNQKVDIINKNNSNWEIITNHGDNDKENRFESSILINCGGAWADDISIKSNLNSLNIMPLRRCLLTFKPHNDEIKDVLNRHINSNNNFTQPWVMGFNENSEEFWYIAPQGKSGLFLCSPANHDADEACDAQITDLEIAICVDRIETFTKCKINKIESKWAGLRCHSIDNNFIIGVDPNDKTNSFYWCAALAGQGIQAAPGYSQLLANMIVGKNIPNHIMDLGLDINDILPSRFYKQEQTL